MVVSHELIAQPTYSLPVCRLANESIGKTGERVVRCPLFFPNNTVVPNVEQLFIA